MSPVIKGKDAPAQIDPFTIAAREFGGQVRRLEYVIGQVVPGKSEPTDLSGIIVALSTLVSKLDDIEKAQAKRHKEIVELLNKKTTIEIKRKAVGEYKAEIAHG